MGQFILNGRNYSGITYAQGVFIDTDNVIASGSIPQGTTTYTATQDCAVFLSIIADSNDSASVSIDGKIVFEHYDSNGIDQIGNTLFVKKGQVVTFRQTYSSAGSYTVYGIQEGSPVTFLSEYASACYDTNEREVGCWVDGKPLYKRTWDFSASPIIIPYNDWVDTGIPASANIEKIISAESQYGSLANMGVEIGTGAGGFAVGLNKLENLNTRGVTHITLQYAKTTD